MSHSPAVAAWRFSSVLVRGEGLRPLSGHLLLWVGLGLSRPWDLNCASTPHPNAAGQGCTLSPWPGPVLSTRAGVRRPVTCPRPSSLTPVSMSREEMRFYPGWAHLKTPTPPQPSRSYAREPSLAGPGAPLVPQPLTHPTMWASLDGELGAPRRPEPGQGPLGLISSSV